MDWRQWGNVLFLSIVHRKHCKSHVYNFTAIFRNKMMLKNILHIFVLLWCSSFFSSVGILGDCDTFHSFIFLWHVGYNKRKWLSVTDAGRMHSQGVAVCSQWLLIMTIKYRLESSVILVLNIISGCKHLFTYSCMLSAYAHKTQTKPFNIFRGNLVVFFSSKKLNRLWHLCVPVVLNPSNYHN